MEHRTLKWYTRALKRIDEIALWYEKNVGEKASENFINDTLKTVNALSLMPTIGKFEKQQGNITLLIHIPSSN